jgi:hypothetical protein
MTWGDKRNRSVTRERSVSKAIDGVVKKCANVYTRELPEIEDIRGETVTHSNKTPSQTEVTLNNKTQYKDNTQKNKNGDKTGNKTNTQKQKKLCQQSKWQQRN